MKNAALNICHAPLQPLSLANDVSPFCNTIPFYSFLDLSLKDLFPWKPFLPLQGWINGSFLWILMNVCAHLYWRPGLPASSLNGNCSQFYSTVDPSYFSQCWVYPYTINEWLLQEWIRERTKEWINTWMNDCVGEWNILKNTERMTYFL